MFVLPTKMIHKPCFFFVFFFRFWSISKGFWLEFTTKYRNQHLQIIVASLKRLLPFELFHINHGTQRQSQKRQCFSLDWTFWRHSNSKTLESQTVSKIKFILLSETNTKNRKSISFSFIECCHNVMEVSISLKHIRKAESLIGQFHRMTRFYNIRLSQGWDETN